MSELPGIPVTPSGGEPTPFVRAPVPAPPVTQPEPPPAPVPPTEPPPTEPDTGAVPGFDKLALLIIVLALVLLASALKDFLNWLFRFMLGPLWPRTGSKQIQTQPLAKALGSALGPFAAKIDPEMGTAFSQIATTTGAMSRAYVSIANRVLKLATGVAALERQAAATQQTSSALRHAIQSQGATITRTATQQAADAKAAAAGQHDVETQVHALAEHITTRIEPELDRLRSQIPALQHGVTTTTKRVEDHDRQLGLDAMVGTVAASMARMGTSYTRCDTNRQLGEKLCESGGSGLRNLLKGLMPIVDIAALCGLVGAIAATGKSKVVTGLLAAFSDGVEGLLACTGATVAEPLPIASPELAPLTGWASLTPTNV